MMFKKFSKSEIQTRLKNILSMKTTVIILLARTNRLRRCEANHYIAQCTCELAWSYLAGCLPTQLVIDFFTQNQQFAAYAVQQVPLLMEFQLNLWSDIRLYHYFLLLAILIHCRLSQSNLGHQSIVHRYIFKNSEFMQLSKYDGYSSSLDIWIHSASRFP